MKKLFLLFATVLLLAGMQACKQKPVDETTNESTDTTSVLESNFTPAAVVDTDTSRVPIPPKDPIKNTLN